ncbi:MAG: hypothetical protein SFV15_16740 [Polyangiaceae bacterium]|nr:hypothetical protein [Polyangiaceae bacterium]
MEVHGEVILAPFEQVPLTAGEFPHGFKCTGGRVPNIDTEGPSEVPPKVPGVAVGLAPFPCPLALSNGENQPILGALVELPPIFEDRPEHLRDGQFLCLSRLEPWRPAFNEVPGVQVFPSDGVKVLGAKATEQARNACHCLPLQHRHAVLRQRVLPTKIDVQLFIGENGALSRIDLGLLWDIKQIHQLGDSWIFFPKPLPD